MDTMTAEDYHAMQKRQKPRKYRNEPTTVDGIPFPSKREARRYVDLKVMEQAGAITDLELQPRYPLVVNGVKIGRYTGDFRYTDTATGATIVEDAKGAARSRDYILRKKLMLALHHVEIVEV